MIALKSMQVDLKLDLQKSEVVHGVLGMHR